MPYDTVDKQRVKIFRDGIPILHATALDEQASKDTTRIPVIGDSAQRVFTGSTSYSGSLTDLMQDLEGWNLINTKESAEFDVQEKADLAGVAKDVGTAAVQQTLTSVATSFEQRFVSLGTTFQSVSLYLKRSATYAVGLKVSVKTTGDVLVGAAFTIPNANLPTTAGWMRYSIPLASRVTVVKGTTYKLVLENATAPAVGATLEFYGAGLKPVYSIGTGDGIVTDFALAHATVIAGTLRILLDGTNIGVGEGYTLDTTPVGDDEVSFSVAPASGVAIKATYQFEDSDNLVGWRLGFSGTAASTYTMQVDMYNASNVLIDSRLYKTVTFTQNGVSVTPAQPLEGTVQFDAEDLVDADAA